MNGIVRWSDRNGVPDRLRRRHAESNACLVAEYLRDHPRVDNVHYLEFLEDAPSAMAGSVRSAASRKAAKPTRKVQAAGLFKLRSATATAAAACGAAALSAANSRRTLEGCARRLLRQPPPDKANPCVQRALTTVDATPILPNNSQLKRFF